MVHLLVAGAIGEFFLLRFLQQLPQIGVGLAGLGVEKQPLHLTKRLDHGPDNVLGAAEHHRVLGVVIHGVSGNELDGRRDGAQEPARFRGRERPRLVLIPLVYDALSDAGEVHGGVHNVQVVGLWGKR
jgi:hypothetical protein